MIFFIIQGGEQSLDEMTFFSFVGLTVVWFLFNKIKSRYSKKTLWIISSCIIAIGIFLSIYTFPNDSVLFGVVVIFFGITVMPLKDVLAKIKSKINKPSSKPSKEESNMPEYISAKDRSNIYIFKGKELKNRKKYKKAIDLFVKALSVNAESEISWFELGQINLIRNRIPEALTCYERAVDIKPNYPEAIERIKEVKQKLNDSKNEQDQK